MDTKEKHRQWHVGAHKFLDMLVADFILNTKGLPTETTIMELFRWSYEQTIAEESNEEA